MSDAVLVALGEPAGRTRWQFEHGGRVFAVFVVDDEVIVTDGLCPHKQGRLGEGILRDGAVICPSHWYAFDLQSGACRTVAGYAITRYPVLVQDGVTYARIPPAPKRSWASILHVHASEGRQR